MFFQSRNCPLPLPAAGSCIFPAWSKKETRNNQLRYRNRDRNRRNCHRNRSCQSEKADSDRDPDNCRPEKQDIMRHGVFPGAWGTGPISLNRSAAPSALNCEAHPYPGLTAGPIHCRPFGPYQALNQAVAIALSPWLRLSRVFRGARRWPQTQARSAGSE
jgi:hypothetical protein